MDPNADELKKSGSRFQVARVNTKEEQIRENDSPSVDESDNTRRKSTDLGKKYTNLSKIDTDLANSNSPLDGRRSISNGPESPCATFSLSGDSVRSRGSVEYSKTNSALNTVEALPCVDHYRNVFSATGGGMRARPTLAELHEELDDEDLRCIKKDEEAAKLDSPGTGDNVVVATPVRFGWIQGVLIRCILNIFGVMLFIRLSWVVGHAGIIQATVIVLLSGLVTTITANSMTAICTNGEVKGGGAYYMISRSLGPEFGGAIGVIFSVANTVAVAMYVVGFSETVVEILKRYDCIMIDNINDVRIIGSITIIVLLGIALVGMDWEARAQVVLLAILTVAILNFFVGLCIPPNAKQMSQGLFGPKEVFVINIFADYKEGETFFTVFAIFFPAATGILAGANISGDLKDASNAIPKGTFLAIFITTLVYLLIAIFVGAFVLREANGIILVSAAEANVTNIVNGVMSAVANTTVAYTTATGDPTAFAGPALNGSVYTVPTTSSIPSHRLFSDAEYSYTPDFVKNCSLIPEGCKYGLIHSYQVIEMTSAWGPLTLAGIFSATLSSALASLMSAPKVFQALCKDKIFPFLAYFGVGYGPNDNPRRAFILCFVIGFAFNLIADLNAIAPLISNFFLMSYALINFSCFDASIAASPGWRPSFRFYNKWLSLGGALLCVGVMFIINWITALITFGCVGSLFLYVHHCKPDVNWGSSTQAHVYRSVLQSALKLVRVGVHIKNFRPQVLVLTGEPENRPALVDFCNHITKKMGLMVCGNIIVGHQHENLRKLRSEAPYTYFRRRHVKSFYSASTASTFQLGAQALMQNVGVGKFRPNLLILGYKSNWQIDNPENVQQYLGIIHDAFDLKLGVGILRVKEGFGLDIDSDITVFTHHEEDQSDDESPRETPTAHSEHHFASGAKKKGDLRGGDIELGRNGRGLIKNSSSKGIFDTLEHEEEGGQGDVTEHTHVLSKFNTQVCSKGGNKGGSENSKVEEEEEEEEEDDDEDEEDEEMQGEAPEQYKLLVLSKLNTQVLKTMNKFRQKEKGTIDVWWLFDDGGLTLLLPYVLTTKAHWQGCRLRVFTAATKTGNLGYEQRQLATLLAKFRIDCKDMSVLSEIHKKPNEESVKMFNSYLAPWRLDPSKGETKKKFPWKTTDDELELLKEKTQRHIRLRELLIERSKDASLIVMTLPMPRKATCAAGLYMCWIDTLTRDMPPILLVRGNQESVLTFYS